MNSGVTIEENLVIQQNAALVGTHESGDGVERKGLARAAGPEQNRESAGGLEFDVERETGGLVPGRKLLANFA